MSSNPTPNNTKKDPEPAGPPELSDGGVDLTMKVGASDHIKMSPELEFLHDVGLTLNDRGEDYGGIEDNFRDIAAHWSVIFGVEVRPDQVPLAMVALKLVRANKSYKLDNAIDIAGYAAHLARMQGDQ